MVGGGIVGGGLVGGGLVGGGLVGGGLVGGGLVGGGLVGGGLVGGGLVGGASTISFAAREQKRMRVIECEISNLLETIIFLLYISQVQHTITHLRAQ